MFLEIMGEPIGHQLFGLFRWVLVGLDLPLQWSPVQASGTLWRRPGDGGLAGEPIWGSKMGVSTNGGTPKMDGL